jgi:hypothetical protein
MRLIAKPMIAGPQNAPKRQSQRSMQKACQRLIDASQRPLETIRRCLPDSPPAASVLQPRIPLEAP